ncbi:MAG: PD40 domain-containing protein [Candidatus Aminicenantes bacterium]|nr:PD40 domain-containing protein [Candidatus Aminicenantes bacterium]
MLNVFAFCQSDFPVLTGPYIGQQPPGITPEVFAPGVVSTKEYLENGCTWSADGKEFYFVRQSDQGGQLLCSRRLENGWTRPEELEHFKKFPGFEPFISVDGKTFFYTRFTPPDQKNQAPTINIWRMSKNGMELGEPEVCVPGMFNSVSRNGNLYVTDVPGHPDRICVYKYENGKYGAKEYPGGGINMPVPGAHPCIAPDESFIIFDSKRTADPGNADLYVCFKQKDGNWSEASSLGSTVNTKWNDICPSLSPDGQYLFFMSKADFYWVSTEIIAKLKAENLEKKRIP